MLFTFNLHFSCFSDRPKTASELENENAHSVPANTFEQPPLPEGPPPLPEGPPPEVKRIYLFQNVSVFCVLFLIGICKLVWRGLLYFLIPK